MSPNHFFKTKKTVSGGLCWSDLRNSTGWQRTSAFPACKELIARRGALVATELGGSTRCQRSSYLLHHNAIRTAIAAML